MLKTLKEIKPSYNRNHNWVISVLIICSLILLITSNIFQAHFSEHLKAQLSDSLNSICNSSHNLVKSWIEIQKSEVVHWSESPDVIRHSRSIISLNSNNSELLIGYKDQKLLRDHMQPLMKSGRYVGYFLIGKDNINLASSRDGNIGQINVMANKNGFLDRAFAGETIISLPTKSEVPLLNRDGDLLSDQPTMFVATPIKNKFGDTIAVFTLRIDPTQGFSDIFKLNAINKSVEIYAVNSQGLMINSSRFESQLKHIGMLTEDQSSILNIKLVNPGINLIELQQSVKVSDSAPLTEAAQQVVNGMKGKNIEGYADYRGVDVVGVWFWDAKYNFGIIVEQDEEEAFDIYRDISIAINVLTAVAILMLIAVVIVFLKSRKQLQEREYQQRSVLNTLLDAVVTIDSKSNIVTFNKAAESIFGYSSKEVINKSVDILMPESYAVSHKQHISHYFRSSDHPNVRRIRPYLTGRKKNGDVFPIEITLNEFKLNNEQMFVGVMRDITERIQNELKLKEERDKAQYYLDTVEVIVMILDQNAHIELVNRKGCELLGYTQLELIGKCFIETIVPENDREAIRQYFRSVLDGKTEPEKNIENTVLTKNGELLNIVWKNAYIKDKEGNIKKILTSGIDVTQSYKIKNELEQQQLLFSSVFEDVPDAMLITNEKFEIIQVNQSFNRVFGFSNEDVLGKSAAIIFENKSDYDSCISSRKNLSLDEQIIPVAVNYHRKNGTSFPGETVRASWHDVEGNVKGCIGVIRDISERYKAEEALKENEVTLQSALDAVEAGSFSYDIASSMIMLDKRSCEIFGLKLHNGIGEIRDWTSILHPDDAKYVELNLKDAIAKNTVYDLLYRIVCPTGEVRHVHSRGIIIRDDDGEAICIKGLNIDDTLNYFANEEKTNLQQQLVQAQKMESIGQLTGGIAHDFNNMLGSIMGFTQLARKRLDGINDQKLESYLSQVSTAGERARDLVKQMLMFSRTEVGDVSIINPDLIIDEVIGMLRPILPSSINIEIDTETKDMFIKCNSVQLNQVLMNLCINARDAMSGKGTITLITRIMETEDEICSSCHKLVGNNYVSIIVSDTGSGIADEIKANIFEPFISTKEVGKGTGMGLSMVHGIIHQHNGHVIVDSTLGEGTSFKLLLPAVDKDAQNLEQPQNEILSIENKQQISKKHIMVVDDETSICQLFAEYLIDNGYETSAFTDSVQALEAFKKSPDKYDCIITDQTMPNLTGIELASKISQIRKDFPIIMQTGYSDHINEQIVEDSAISVLLKKPVDVDKMISIIHGIFDKI